MSDQRLIFNSRDELLRIEAHNIVYFEADGNYTHIVFANNLKATVSMTLSTMEERLAQTLNVKKSLFARIGKRHIVNLNYVYKVNPLKKQLVLTDFSTFSYQLEVSKEALRQLKEIMLTIKI